MNDDIKSFKLYENYPNPFNPSTKIKFDLPEDVYVVLILYDNSGRELEVLVNEYKEKGTYSISFNASELSSGIYYYKMHAGTYIEVKKMILLK